MFTFSSECHSAGNCRPAGRIEPMNGSLGISTMNDEETLNHLHKWLRIRNEAEAQIVRGLEHFFRLREHIEDGKYAHDEIAAELSWSTLTAARHVHTAVRLVERLPGVVDALEVGQVDMPKARAI